MPRTFCLPVAARIEAASRCRIRAAPVPSRPSFRGCDPWCSFRPHLRQVGGLLQSTCGLNDCLGELFAKFGCEVDCLLAAAQMVALPNYDAAVVIQMNGD